MLSDCDANAKLEISPDPLLEWILSDPERAQIEIDRELVERGGLLAFIRLGWSVVEPEGSFTDGWHIRALCSHLEKVMTGEIRRLLITMPPRHMKSLACAVFFPAWAWIQRPEMRFLFSSYSQDLSFRDSIACRNIIASDWYQARWGDRFKLSAAENQVHQFSNTKTGRRQATSVGAKGTGLGGSIIVVDDPHDVKKAESEEIRSKTTRWWDETMASRVNDPRTGAFIIIQQRVHENDLAGHVMKRRQRMPYTHLCLPAEFEPDHPHRWAGDPRVEPGELLWPEHMPRAELEELKESLGPFSVAGQLQQRPTPREGGLFKRRWFEIASDLPPGTISWVRGWDLAASVKQIAKSSPDYTAQVLMGRVRHTGKFVIGEAMHWRCEPDEVRRLVRQKAETPAFGTPCKHVKISIPQDPGQAGKDQARQYATMLAGWSVAIEPQTGDKATRAMGFAAQAAAGNVTIVAGDWDLEAFLAELTGFPNAEHDDFCDAASSAFNRLLDGTTGMLDYYREMSDAHDAAPRPVAGPEMNSDT